MYCSSAIQYFMYQRKMQTLHQVYMDTIYFDNILCLSLHLAVIANPAVSCYFNLAVVYIQKNAFHIELHLPIFP